MGARARDDVLWLRGLDRRLAQRRRSDDAVEAVALRTAGRFETAEKAGKALEAWLSARMRDAVSQPGKLFLHPDLSLLFSRVASDQELKVLAALRANPLGVADLSDAVGLPYEDVEQALAELLRRGVLMTEAPVDNSSSASGVHDAPPES